MNIDNLTYQVPEAVRDIFYGYLPFGSDYVMYCDHNQNGSVSYRMDYRRVGDKTFSYVVVSRSSASSDWSISDGETEIEADSLVVSQPYFAYSNIQGQGRYTVLPSGQNLCVLLLIVIASLAVLRVVFGGIKLWVTKSEPY